MTAPGQVPFDPELLQRHSIISRTPSWKNVLASITRLRTLQQSSIPYDQMDLDRDDIFSFYSNLRTASDSIVWSICLASHLARFSKSQTSEQRLNDGFQALSSGLELASLTDIDTRNELQRCAQAAFPDLNLQFPPMATELPSGDTAPAQQSAAPEHAPADAAGAADASGGRPDAASPPPPALPPPAADPWGTAVEAALSEIALAERPPMEEVIQKANEGWNARLLGLLTSPDQPEISPDIDYLRCRAANDPLGMVLRGRLKNVSLREWNEAYVSGMSVTGAATPVPLWFAVAALCGLGFDVPRDFMPSDPKESAGVSNFTSRLPIMSQRKGLMILRLTADSQTARWRSHPSIPVLILTAEDAARDPKVNVQKYFQERLHGVLIEVGRGETPSDAQKRAANYLSKSFQAVTRGLLMMERAVGVDSQVKVAVNPADAFDAYLQTFVTSTTTASPQPASPKPS